MEGDGEGKSCLPAGAGRDVRLSIIRGDLARFGGLDRLELEG